MLTYYVERRPAACRRLVVLGGDKSESHRFFFVPRTRGLAVHSCTPLRQVAVARSVRYALTCVKIRLRSVSGNSCSLRALRVIA